jgi:hypothetical protein
MRRRGRIRLDLLRHDALMERILGRNQTMPEIIDDEPFSSLVVIDRLRQGGPP